jgi:hypothetical protein
MRIYPALFAAGFWWLILLAMAYNGHLASKLLACIIKPGLGVCGS